MPTPTALHLHTSATGSAIAAVRNSTTTAGVTTVGSRFSSTNSCRICQCSVDGTVPFRAWIVLKESRSGSRSAWFHTFSDKGFAVEAKRSNDSEAVDENREESEKELLPATTEEKPVRLQRRQRSSFSGGNTPAAAPLANPDLLTIPGVGPRNLKKLVKKGIRGVAELKQIYKDKVPDGSIENRLTPPPMQQERQSH